MKAGRFPVEIVLAAVMLLLAPMLAIVQAKTFIVNVDTDAVDAYPGDGVCAISGFMGYCSLHAAIQEANLDSEPSTIKFSKQMDISYPDLPPLTDASTTIDASDQWNGTWPDGSPGVQIGAAGDTNGLLEIQGDRSKILGMEFYGSSSVGISLSAASSQNQIGGSGSGERNVFYYGIGVKVQSTGAGNLITNNYFGTKDGMTSIPGEKGIYILYSSGNKVEKNLIVGHTVAGINIWQGATNFVQNDNIIGANRLKNAALGNLVGVKIDESQYNTVMGNAIAGNTSHGIEIWRAKNNTVVSNYIGMQWGAFGNDGHGIYVTLGSNNNFIGKKGAGNSISHNGGNGVFIQNISSDNLVQSNTIRNNTLDGVSIDSCKNNTVGGPGAGNEIFSNSGSGIHLTGTFTTDNKLWGNFIGMSMGGWNAGNKGYGVLIEAGASSNAIGGLDAGKGNIIGWNGQSGIAIGGATTEKNVVEGNLIGAPEHWKWKAPNDEHGIVLNDGTHNNWIGIGNTIVANKLNGIVVSNSNNNVIWSNWVGTSSGRTKWGNGGIGIALAYSGGNTVAYNEVANNGFSRGGAGVFIFAGGSGNPLVINSIYDNNGPGIELSNGGNGYMASPSIITASCKGPVTGTSCPGCTVEIFSDYADEGRYYEGTVQADAVTGAFSWKDTLQHGPKVTATATSSGKTSAFSQPVTTGRCGCKFLVLPLPGGKASVICL